MNKIAIPRVCFDRLSTNGVMVLVPFFLSVRPEPVEGPCVTEEQLGWHSTPTCSDVAMAATTLGTPTILSFGSRIIWLEHVAGYTCSRRPLTLVWCADFPSRYEALVVERKLKGWSRAKKEALVAGDWERVSLLARNRQGTGPSTGSGRTGVGKAGQIEMGMRGSISNPVGAELVEAPSAKAS